VDAGRWRRDRKVARAGVDVSHFGAKSQPSDGAHVNPAAKLNRIRVGVRSLLVEMRIAGNVKQPRSASATLAQRRPGAKRSPERDLGKVIRVGRVRGRL
jgi:hypothetical protein